LRGLEGPNLRLSLVVSLLAALPGMPVGAQALTRVQMQDLMVQCAACHGADGIARDSEVPNLACQHDRYLYNQLLNFKSGKRPHKEMRFMGRRMSEQEMDAIADYYSSLPCR
jgi:cytochrome c553